MKRVGMSVSNLFTNEEKANASCAELKKKNKELQKKVTSLTKENEALKLKIADLEAK